jgi:ABC-type dipeptide/oligopeptide/nickel transport system permease component
MGQYIARRMLQAVPLLFLISLVAFMMIRLSGGRCTPRVRR